jgi:hypothetical protein
MAEGKVLATGETKRCSKCGETAMVVLKDGKRYILCRACSERRQRLQSRSFETKKAAREAGLRNATEWIRTGFAVQKDAFGVEVKGERFFEQLECEPALDIITAAARDLSPKRGAVAVQHDAKSLKRPIYFLADFEARRPSLSEIVQQGVRGLTSAEIEQLLANAGHLGRIAIEVRQCGGVDGPYHVAKLEELLRQDDCGLSWGFIEITTNGGISFWTYLVIDLPVGQLVTCDCSQQCKIPEYRGEIRDYSVLRDFERIRALRHAFVEWVFDRRSVAPIAADEAMNAEIVSIVARKFLAFDIETAKDVPGDDFNWRPHRPLGISCAATFSTECKSPRLWYGGQRSDTPTQKMQISEVAELVRYLLAMAKSGFTIVTWNGIGFDFDVLAEESALFSECQQLALEHVDMMFHVFCTKGFPVALDNAARGTGIAGKAAGMSGVKAPQLWIEGRHQEVLDYAAQDVRTTLSLACACEQRRSLSWITRKGATSACPLPSGWLSVKDSLRLPDPDTSWMDSPMSRSQFTGWIRGR